MIGKWLHKADLFFREVTPQMGWLVITFTIISIADIIAPPQYILAYLYIVPIFISLSLLNKKTTLIVLLLAVSATISDMFLPTPLEEWSVPYIVISRFIAILFMVTIVSFFFYRNRYREQLQKQEKLLSEAYHLAQLREDFIAALSHDLKTPLLGGQKVLQYFVNGTFGKLTEEQRAAIETLLRGNSIELELIETLLTIYRNDNVGVQVQTEAVNINELIQSSISQLQYLGREQEITLNLVASDYDYIVQADKLQVQRVILNLLHNALNYAPTNSEIQIQLSDEDNFLKVSIRDQGPGLSLGDLKNIFLRFYQVESEQRPMLSSGLGLYLSRQIIEAHEGEIWAENLEPTGCQINFTLPCVDKIPHSATHSIILPEVL